MRILSISAQKPDSTGSGVYMTELIRAFADKGYEQGAVAGIGPEDRPELPEGIRFYPVRFETEDLPFPVAGMSDEMPYRSTRYCDMTEEMTAQFSQAFLKVIDQAVRKLQPDVILCHHLYLLTALVRKHYPERRVYGFCHNTDLRQMQKNPLQRSFIAEQICDLDGIFALQAAQTAMISEIYGADTGKIHVVGIGYNDRIFFQSERKRNGSEIRIAYAGKIAEKKGVMSLLRAMEHLPYRTERIHLFLAGGAGNQKEYEEARALARRCRYPVEFLGKLSQQNLAKLYNMCDIFVLPSFCEGLPLTPVEALACGDRVVMTDLPGIRPWLTECAPGADVLYVRPPRMRGVDEPVEEDLPGFEQRLGESLWTAARAVQEQGNLRKPAADLRRIRWEQVAARVGKAVGIL